MSGKHWERQFRLKPSCGAQRSQMFPAQVAKSGITRGFRTNCLPQDIMEDWGLEVVRLASFAQHLKVSPKLTLKQFDKDLMALEVSLRKV